MRRVRRQVIDDWQGWCGLLGPSPLAGSCRLGKGGPGLWRGPASLRGHLPFTPLAAEAQQGGEGMSQGLIQHPPNSFTDSPSRSHSLSLSPGSAYVGQPHISSWCCKHASGSTLSQALPLPNRGRNGAAAAALPPPGPDGTAIAAGSIAWQGGMQDVPPQVPRAQTQEGSLRSQATHLGREAKAPGQGRPPIPPPFAAAPAPSAACSFTVQKPHTREVARAHGPHRA